MLEQLVALADAVDILSYSLGLAWRSSTDSGHVPLPRDILSLRDSCASNRAGQKCWGSTSQEKTTPNEADELVHKHPSFFVPPWDNSEVDPT